MSEKTPEAGITNGGERANGHDHSTPAPVETEHHAPFAAETPVLVARNLSRKFGKVQAVNGVSLAIGRGQVVGFVGANGAGKTTTMRILATLEVPDEGEVEVDGEDALAFPREARRKLGWMPDGFGVYKGFSVENYLEFFAHAHGLRRSQLTARLAEVIDFVGLGKLQSRPVDKLSKGEKQRLGLGRTLLGNPAVMILDEPAAGLDPQARLELKNLIRILSEEGRTIFISSHILSELAEMCDRMIFIDQGKIVHDGHVEDLQRGGQKGSALIRVRVAAGGEEPLQQWLQLNPGAKLHAMERDGATIAADTGEPEALTELLARMIRDGLPVWEFRVVEQRLEEAFVELLGRLREEEKES